MKKRHLSGMFIFIGVLFAGPGIAQQNDQWDWAKSFGGRGKDYVHSIVTDSKGNSFICGSFSDSIRFGDKRLTSSGYLDIFLARYDAKGDLRWVKSAGGPDADEAYGIATDNAGDLYVTGYFSGKAAFSGQTLSSKGDRDMFVAKYRNDGTQVWVRQLGGDADDYGNAITVDGSGNVYVCGIFHNTIELGNSKFTSKGEKDIFLVKFNPSGDLLWGATGGGDREDEATALAVDQAGNCYVTGHFENQADFGKKSVISTGRKDIFLAKYDPLGAIIWLKKAGSATADDYSTAMILDPDEDIYISGYFSGTAYFGKTELKSLHGNDFFLARYAPDGEVRWASQSGGAGDEHARDLAIDRSGNVYVAGEFNADFTIGANKVINRGDWDVFVAKYSPEGKMLKGFQAGGLGYDRATGISIDASSNLYVAGYYTHQIGFGNIKLSGDKETEGFIAKLKAIQ